MDLSCLKMLVADSLDFYWIVSNRLDLIDQVLNMNDTGACYLRWLDRQKMSFNVLKYMTLWFLYSLHFLVLHSCLTPSVNAIELSHS